jgi:hypothetical protein
MGVHYEHYLIPEDNTYKPRSEEFSRLVNALLDGGFVPEEATHDFPKKTFDAASPSDIEEEVGCFVHLGDGQYSLFPCPCSPGDIAVWGERDFILVWSVQSSNESGLKYPLIPFPEWGDAYYDLELRVAKDFVYHLSDLIDPFDKVACACGRVLCYSEWDEPSTAELIESDPSSGRYSYGLSDEPPRLPLYADSRIYRLCPSCGKPFRPQALTARVRDGWKGESVHRPRGATYLFAVVIDCGKGFAREGWPIRASEEFIDTVARTLGQDFYEIGDIH